MQTYTLLFISCVMSNDTYFNILQNCTPDNLDYSCSTQHYFEIQKVYYFISYYILYCLSYRASGWILISMLQLNFKFSFFILKTDCTDYFCSE